MAKLRIKETLRLIRAMGLSAGYRDGEYRVNLHRPEGSEATAYYTEDGQDALDTATRMSRDAKMRRGCDGPGHR